MISLVSFPPLISPVYMLLLVHDFVLKLNGLLCASIRGHFLYAVPSPYAFLGIVRNHQTREQAYTIRLGV